MWVLIFGKLTCIKLKSLNAEKRAFKHFQTGKTFIILNTTATSEHSSEILESRVPNNPFAVGFGYQSSPNVVRK